MNALSNESLNFINSAFSVVVAAANNIWGYTLATINFFTIIVLVPVILYYFLRDWPQMVKGVESILPLKEKGKVGRIFLDINNLLSAYIRGQLNICLLLSLYYIVGLNLIGIDLALLLGIISGFLVITLVNCPQVTVIPNSSPSLQDSIGSIQALGILDNANANSLSVSIIQSIPYRCVSAMFLTKLAISIIH